MFWLISVYFYIIRSYIGVWESCLWLVIWKWGFTQKHCLLKVQNLSKNKSFKPFGQNVNVCQKTFTIQCKFSKVKLIKLDHFISLWCWQWVEGDCRRANRGLVCAITQHPSPLHRSSRMVAVIQTLSQASITLAVWSQATEWKKLHWIFQSFKMPIAPYGPIPSKHEKTRLFLGRQLSLYAIHSRTPAQTKDKPFSLIILKHIKWSPVLSPTAQNWCKLVASQLLSACGITHAHIHTKSPPW